jgi:hypothetical protein
MTRTGRRDLRRCGREDLVLPKKLAAEAAADEGRGEARLVAFRPEHLRDGPRFMRHRLRGVVNPQGVALLGEHAGVQLDRRVVVAGRRVRDIHLVRSGNESGLGVADLLPQRLAHEQPGLCSLRFGDGKQDDRILLFVNDADQCLRVLGLLLRLGEHDPLWSPRPDPQ